MDEESMMGDMSDHDLAAELQRTRDDPTEWGDAEPAPTDVRTEKRRLAAMVSVRFAPEELAALQEHVRALGLTISGFLRQLALAQIQRPSETSRPATGFRIVDASVGARYSTTSQYVHAQVVTLAKASA
jgi:hypothetical protein